MMRKLLYSFLLFFFLHLISYGQCNSYPTSSTQVGSDITMCYSDNPATITQTITARQYAVLNVISGFTYTFRINNIWGTNQSLSIYDAAGNVYLGGSSSNNPNATVTYFTPNFSGKIRILVLRGTGCSNTGGGGTNGTLTITQTALGNNLESQNEYGTNNWVGHIYNFNGGAPPGGSTSPLSPASSNPFATTQYAGYYNVLTESINENFGGDAACFPVYSNGVQRASIYTETFAVRYKMKTTKVGCYLVTITGDDGVRLYLNGTNVLDRWVEQGSTTYSNVLVRLDGDDDFVFDYYENGGANVVGFSMVPFDTNSNTITAPSTVNFCNSGDPAVIGGSLQFSSGDANLQNPQFNFQWQLSTDGVTFDDIIGATSRTYDPPVINSNNIRYYRRLVNFAASMTDVNGVKSGCTYSPSNIVRITAYSGIPVLQTAPTSGTVTQCPNLTGQTYSVTATNAVSYNWSVPAGWSITSGQGTNTITVNTGNAGQNGNITVTATNGCGTTAAKNLAVTVVASPTISSQPSTTVQTVCRNSAATALSVTATAGSGTISNYSWYSNTTNSTTGGTIVASSTANTYTPSTASTGTLYYYVIVTNSNGCSLTSAVSGAITVNPVHTITAGADRNVCQNAAMTNITMTLGGGATGATITGLPTGLTYSVTTNTLTITGTPRVSGVFAYTVTTTGNSCATATTSGTINVGTGNNIITFSNGTSGTVCANPPENGTATFVAPSGTYFNNVNFASYGSPTGACGSFQINYICHSTYSQSVTEGFLLGSTGTISFLANNANFQDPCVNTVKSFAGSARYSEPVCVGSIPGQITGTVPTGNAPYAYLWEMSTTSATAGFGPAPGTNNGQNYTPTDAVTGNTWFRRTVTSNGTCPNVSSVVLIKTKPRATSVISGTGNVCNGSSRTVSVALTGTAPWSLTYSDGSASTNVTGITASPYTFNVSPTNNTTYTITALNDANNCPSVAANMTGSAVITVNPRPTAAVSGSATICRGDSTPVSVSFTGTGPWNIAYTYGATSGTFSTSSNPYTVNVNPTSNTTYSITGLSDANCTATAADITGSAVITVRALPSTPTVTKNNDVTCENLGSVTVSGLPSGSWTIHQTGTASQDITGTGGSRTITGLVQGTYHFTVTNNTTTCTSDVASQGIVNLNVVTTWNGSAWSNGDPDENKRVIIASVNPNQPFPDSGVEVDIKACSLEITIPVGSVVTIPSKATLTVTNALTTNDKLIFESGSSLLQGTNAINSGNISYKRKVSLTRYDVVYWGSPVTNSAFSMATFSPYTLHDKFHYWNAVNSTWILSDYGPEIMTIGKGYAIRAPQYFNIETPEIFEGIFVGEPNNGDVSVPVLPSKLNFIGNPYPSAVDANGLLDENKDHLGALYFWTHALPPQQIPGTNTFQYLSADFVVYTKAGSTRVSGEGVTGTEEFDGFIGAGQAFFTVSPATASEIKFNNGLRKGSSNNTQFYKTAESKQADKNRIWLNVANSKGAFKQLLLGYMDGATNGIDLAYDATTMNANSNVDFYTINEGKKLTIQGRALPFDNTEVIPLGFKCGIDASGDRNFTFSLDHTDGFFDTQEVYLEDKILGKIIDLRKENYTFPSGTGTYSTRFVLRYTNKTLGTGEFEDLENSVLVSVKDKSVKITSSKEILKEVNIFNVGAQQLYTNNKVNASELQITNLHSSDQVLLVQIILENGHTFTKKVIFSNL